MGVLLAKKPRGAALYIEGGNLRAGVMRVIPRTNVHHALMGVLLAENSRGAALHIKETIHVQESSEQRFITAFT